MNKLRLLFSLLLYAVMGGVNFALADVGDVITTIDGISPSKVYTIKVSRGYMPSSNGVSQMYGTDNESDAGKFAFIPSSRANEYYIYSADNNKFLTSAAQNDNVYHDIPTHKTLTFTITENDGTFILASKQTGNWLQLGGSKQYTITDGSWKTKDTGNQWEIKEAGDLDNATTMADKVSKFENPVPASALSELSDTKAYVLRTRRNYLNASETAASSHASNYVYWAILHGSRGYYLYDIDHAKFLGTNDLNSTLAPTSHFEIEQVTADEDYTFTIKSTKTNCLLQMNGEGTLLITNSWSTIDEGNRWMISDAGEYDLTSAIAQITEFEAEITATDITSINDLDDTGIYLLKSREYDGYLKGNIADNGRVLFEENANVNDHQFQWCIYKDNDGYVFYNIGTQTYLINHTSTASEGEWKMTSTPLFVYNNITETTADSKHYYSIQNKEYVDTQSFLHVNRDKLTVNWGTDAYASQFTIQRIANGGDMGTTIATALMNAARNKLTELTNTAQSPRICATGGIGFYTAATSNAVIEIRDAAIAVKDNAGATKTQVLEQIRTLNPLIDALVPENPATNKMYAIKSVNAGEYADGSNFINHGGTPKLSHSAKGDNGFTAGQIWAFDAIGKGYCYDDGHGLTSTIQHAGINNTETFRFEGRDASTKAVSIKLAAYWYTRSESEADFNHFIDRNGETYDPDHGKFIVEEVDAVPVTIGTTGYATLNLPVATTIPEGVKAWAATGAATDGVIALTKVEGTLPANCAVILTGQPKTYHFNVTADAGTATSAFQGTVAAQATPTEGKTFVLSVIDDAVSLYKYTAADLPGFKMYYTEAGNTSGGSLVRLKFSEIETAIKAAHTDMQEGAVYSINGQRVQKAQHGIYIVNGKKILVNK